LSLLAFIARQIERRTDRTVSPDDLRNWLSFYPWFLVLDGLDEVPSSTNREDVLKKVEDFWIDAAQVNADVLVLATTRPQGYSDDFSPTYYCHLVLASLSPQRAMAYAERLVDVRYAGEPDRQQKILTRLQKASTQEATARLMRSPLQITIMAALVDQTGNPPQDRWRLFHDYYEVIYNRERERPIPAAELLRDYKPNIDAIHHQVGLILQVESERAGGTEAKLLADRFAGLVTGRLEEEGFSGQALHTLRERFIDAAANRLVFLVGLEAGQVGFEIRSLQEYMAAEAIMTGSQDKIQERLRRFAPIASWRNVFLFAAGRCFLQEQHLRDTIHTICIELNDQLAGPVGRVTLAGAALALDLLEDGVALRQPKYARLLAQCASRVLELPPTEIHGRLADVCEGEVETIIRESLENKLAVPDSKSSAAWATLLALIGRGPHWASELAEQSWPSDPSQQLTILSLPTAERAESWVNSREEAVIKRNPPQEAFRFIQHLFHKRPQRPARFYEWTPWAFERPGLEEPSFDFPRWGFSFFLPPIDQVRRYALDVNLDSSNVHPRWLPTIEEVKFSQSPSMQTLTNGLRRVAAVSEAFVPGVLRPHLSWVFGSCLASARSQVELNNLVERADRGDLGDLRNWLAAENRWKERGITLEDLLHLTDDRWPFDGEIAERGFPVAAASYFGWTRRNKIPLIDEDFLSCLNDVPQVQSALAPRLLLSFVYSRQTFSLQLLTKLVRLTITQTESFPFDVVLLAAQKALRDEGWLGILDEMGTATTSYVGYFHRNLDETGLQALITLFLRHPACVGLLSLIAQGLTSYPLAVAAKIESLDLPRVRFEQYDDPKIRWAAVVLELIQGGLKKERAHELAAITTMLQSQGVGNLAHALDALSRSEQFDEITDHYLLELRRQLLDAQEGEQAQVIKALNNALRRRSSGVTKLGVWRDLALPEKLLDLVATSRS